MAPGWHLVPCGSLGSSPVAEQGEHSGTGSGCAWGLLNLLNDGAQSHGKFRAWAQVSPMMMG